MAHETISQIWKRRSLIRTFAINDLVIRYKSSGLGVVWSLLEPLLMFGVLYVIFTNVFKSTVENYPLYLLLGIIMWSFFSRATTMGIGSIISRAGIIKQIYFPREILPISSCVTALVMMGIEFGVFFAFVVVFQFLPSISILILPGLLFLLFCLSVGISLFLSVLNVKFRDIQSVWGVVMYAGFFISPVIYSLDTFPEELRRFLLINPVAQILEMAHNSVLYGTLPSLSSVAYTVGVTFGILILGYFTFRHYQFKMVEEL